MAEWIALIIGILGVAGVIFTALKYNRDDTTAIVTQQNVIVGEMKILNDELRDTVTRLRSERDELAKIVETLRAEVRDG